MKKLFNLFNLFGILIICILGFLSTQMFQSVLNYVLIGILICVFMFAMFINYEITKNQN